jgi:hypothetical protein
VDNVHCICEIVRDGVVLAGIKITSGCFAEDKFSLLHPNSEVVAEGCGWT